MIEGALNRYNNDRLGKTDFALFSAGARIIPGLTSLSFEPPARGLAQRLWRKLGMVSSHSPTTVLDPDTHVGECWPMRGSSGQVAIHLAQPVDVSDFAIEHVARSIAIDWRSAPRQVEIWGYLTLLASHEYAPSDASALQIIRPDTDSEHADRSIRVRTIILKIKSNWGHPDHTCIYRFRVHGHPVAI
ncbi:hypothetical protein COEREDRAFT_37566 [Coemansia reversa NRRL 1564]|uniref:SUN domain-containing protein n=1 Tax=Coemansia reversa (strain ATCC 12441 / NRRL 1564) TaxID=763665 RepID=A0A2G5BKA3_COERN|nr:hypothetical protein COEREDRAFT_37566 [Coemansia reversa NRRL 1564]|eukprot:PIA19421.1 hypothetical protein COEREDRAFT_37566 [Coemansia reversa NRRL 1564]